MYSIEALREILPELFIETEAMERLYEECKTKYRVFSKKKGGNVV